MSYSKQFKKVSAMPKKNEIIDFFESVIYTSNVKLSRHFLMIISMMKRRSFAYTS